MLVDRTVGTSKRVFCVNFISDYNALFKKMFLLSKRNFGQTFAEILLSSVFMGLILAMRYVLVRDFNPNYKIPRFRPHDIMEFTEVFSNTTYYYPDNPCTTAIIFNAIDQLSAHWAIFPSNVQSVPNPNISSLFNVTKRTLYAFIHFTNLDHCSSSLTMPDKIEYTLRMQEDGPYYYRAHSVKIDPDIYLWKRSPQDFCQDTSTTDMYTAQFLGMQYFIDLSIIQYSTNITADPSSVFMSHYGCPSNYYDSFHTEFGFFVIVLFSLVFMMTFILNVGYIVDERRNKVKEYLRIFGLRTWINNLVWITRSMCVYIVLASIVTIFSVVVLPSANSSPKSTHKALFNYAHWTVVWTVLFVYSFQLSTFSVFFGQCFTNPLLAKFLSFVIWIATFVDFYIGGPLAIRYVMCLFPNSGLLFCLEIIQQYERKGDALAGAMTFRDLYSNIFSYPFYMGICLLLMLIYSMIYMFLAVYVERVNPGPFGISQSLFYPCGQKRKTSKTLSNSFSNRNRHQLNDEVNTTNSKRNHWIEMESNVRQVTPLLRIENLTKRFGNFTAVSDFSFNFYPGEVCALLGHNGAGKTTITFIIVGMMEATSGSVTLEGLDHQQHMEETRKMIGFCPQYDILYDKLSVQEHLELFAQMRHIDPGMVQESIDTILDLIGLSNDRCTLSQNLSGGMKRRLSIGISLIGDPKVLILDEPTSGIDPYNRRLICIIIQKMKDAGKCVILTTHFLEEADVLSDRVAIMSHGRLQASGTPDFLKQQTEYEYRLFIDKQDECNSDHVATFIRQTVETVTLERQTSSELVFGIKRGATTHIDLLIRRIEEHRSALAINGYGLSMATMEEVFLKLIQEEEQQAMTFNQQEEPHVEQTNIAKNLFSIQYHHTIGIRLFWSQVWALFVKKSILSRRQISFLLGFFLIPVLIEIITVAVLPTPNAIQSSMLQKERIPDARIQLHPSIYTPHTIPTYSNDNTSEAYLHLVAYLMSENSVIDQLSTNTIVDKVVSEWKNSEDVFINKYQIGFGIFTNKTSIDLPLITDAYFSTVNYHAMATSLSVAMTNLFQFYANSSSKVIVTTNQPILLSGEPLEGKDLFFEMVFCFDTLPLALFNFVNSVLAGMFIALLSSSVIRERRAHSKDLQLLTRLSKFTYWFSTVLYDFTICLVLCTFLTIIVEIAAKTRVNPNAEVLIYAADEPMSYFFLMFILYSLASLPYVYVYSFIPGTELIGLVVYFIVNVLVCFLDVVLGFMGVFSGTKTLPDGTVVNRTGSIMTAIRWVLSVLFPSVNLKHALFNIRLRSSDRCVAAVNSVMATNYSSKEPWMSLKEPGLGMQFLIFVCQIIFCWFLVLLIEKLWKTIVEKVRSCSKQRSTVVTSVLEWNNAVRLDDDVENERQLILRQAQITESAAVIVRDLVQEFKKQKGKSSSPQIHKAVDHLNFFVLPSSCFGLLGANGAGKTTTFRMLIHDIRPTSGEVIINRSSNNHCEIGYCPQFDWLVDHLNVRETLTLFARLKGLMSVDIDEICTGMIQCFGLAIHEKKQVQNLSGGNKRKVSAALAFMANPTLIFLDEPTTGLDAAAKRKVWSVIRAARDAGRTIIMTSHSMEECEALCTKIGIMKSGQFLCLGSLQHLKNRFGNGYAVQIKVSLQQVDQLKRELELCLPGINIEDEHNGILYCHVPLSASNNRSDTTNRFYTLADVFELFNKKKADGKIESFSLTQTTLEQIFVNLIGHEDENDALLFDPVANESSA